MDPLPLIRLDVLLSELKLHVCQAISQRTIEVEKIVAEQLERILTSDKVLAAIEDECIKVVEQEIRWKAHTIVREALEKTRKKNDHTSC